MSNISIFEIFYGGEEGCSEIIQKYFENLDKIGVFFKVSTYFTDWNLWFFALFKVLSLFLTNDNSIFSDWDFHFVFVVSSYCVQFGFFFVLVHKYTLTNCLNKLTCYAEKQKTKVWNVNVGYYSVFTTSQFVWSFIFAFFLLNKLRHFMSQWQMQKISRQLCWFF